MGLVQEPSFSITRRCGSRTGRVRNITLSSSEKIAVFAPMPSASDRMATADTTGVARNERSASRKSDMASPRRQYI